MTATRQPRASTHDIQRGGGAGALVGSRPLGGPDGRRDGPDGLGGRRDGAVGGASLMVPRGAGQRHAVPARAGSSRSEPTVFNGGPDGARSGW